MIARHLTSAVLGSMHFFGLLTAFNNLVPVTIFMEVKSWDRSRSAITAEIIGYKLRDCAIVKGSSVGWLKHDEWSEVPFKFVDDLTPDSSKPATFDKQSFGLWRWKTAPRDGKEIKMTIQHDCDGSVRTTTVGPFVYEVGN